MTATNNIKNSVDVKETDAKDVEMTDEQNLEGKSFALDTTCTRSLHLAQLSSKLP